MCGHAPCDLPRCTWSEVWRFECEARDIMRKPYDVRTAYYRDVEKRRGKDEKDKLIAEVNRQWKDQQQTQRTQQQQRSHHPQPALEF